MNQPEPKLEPQSSAHCHKQIRTVAKEACALHYEMLMSSSNVVYQMWKKQHPGLNAKKLQQAFVNKHWSKCIELARSTLGALLTQPIDERTKEEIMQVLVLDSTLIRGRQTPAIVVGEINKAN